MRWWIIGVTALFAGLAAPALAHPGHAHAGFLDGLLHPAGGADHLAAMVAVGLWAGLVGSARRWAWPAVFVIAMVAGAGLGWSSLPVPAVETLVAGSVVALGGAIALGWSPPLAVGAAAVAALGAVHGFVHGAEMPGEAFLGAYAAGFVTGTALLHGAGLALADWIAGAGLRPVASRLAGAALAVLGAGLVGASLLA